MLLAHRIVTVLISPLGTALVLGLLAGLLAWWCQRQARRQAPQGRARLARRAVWLLGISALAWLTLWSTPGASQVLRRGLESQYPAVPVQALPSAEVIVVLGGGIAPPLLGVPPETRQANLNAAADRLWHAARVYQAGKAPKLLATGGMDEKVYAASEAEAMAQFLQALGVPRSAMLLEGRSRNTEQNAQFTMQLLREQNIQPRILLVTSALHMPRAMTIFQAYGFEATAVATDHEGSETTHWPWWQAWIPDADSLQGSARAMKEWVGRKVILMRGPVSR
ncbi:MAG: YdcF family protein [Rubrivivax sp.]|nr:YdcF family protein [Rubrivivax sp.]